ncbi:MAG: glycerophosphodiester phosphodiesterase family protein, partial [Clostridia bacterium]|nr:glycerophosphodiester phosphodiesterase family protein [Clostridia bacterium]
MDTLHLSSPKPRMIAHRGLSGIELENTCSAFVAAGNRSHFGIETDVHVTQDGQYIIIHDDSTKRVGLDDLIVENSTFETLRSLRLADKDGKRGRKDLLLPSLAEYVQICRKYEKISVLELKNHMQPEDIDGIISVIEKEGWLDKTIFISFDLPNVVYTKEKLPEQKVQYLIGGDMKDWDEVMSTLNRYHLDLDIYYKMLTEERVKELHAAGIEVNVWTVDHLEDAERLAAWGVDYITSN